jgi:hypothetical protein
MKFALWGIFVVGDRCSSKPSGHFSRGGMCPLSFGNALSAEWKPVTLYDQPKSS